MKKVKSDVRYSKEDIMSALSLDFFVDSLDVILDDGEFYTLDEVYKLYDDFLSKKEVR